ncbi:hypothetical protein MPLA_750090 [Mesorhizobium sp. ORS 3359]|nr:hypothetical protein MPLA_750090 [Mesorhizobium sp. ORS 3359]
MFTAGAKPTQMGETGRHLRGRLASFGLREGRPHQDIFECSDWSSLGWCKPEDTLSHLVADGHGMGSGYGSVASDFDAG